MQNMFSNTGFDLINISNRNWKTDFIKGSSNQTEVDKHQFNRLLSRKAFQTVFGNIAWKRVLALVWMKYFKSWIYD